MNVADHPDVFFCQKILIQAYDILVGVILCKHQIRFCQLTLQLGSTQAEMSDNLEPYIEGSFWASLVSTSSAKYAFSFSQSSSEMEVLCSTAFSWPSALLCFSTPSSTRLDCRNGASLEMLKFREARSKAAFTRTCVN